MKPALFFVLALGATSASACANYYYCHCTQKDGTADNKATRSICNNWYEGRARAPWGGITECDITPKLLNNCEFRKLCAVAFATGSDSFCR